MNRDPSAVDGKLVALVRELSKRAGRPADEQEARAALASLGPAEERELRRFGKGEPPAQPLGPMGWADVARGVEPEVAAAREASGYYLLLAERDALASVLHARTGAAPAVADHDAEASDPDSDDDVALDDDEDDDDSSLADDHEDEDDAEEEAPAEELRRTRRSRVADAAERQAQKRPAPQRAAATPAPVKAGRAQAILTLFAYHRDSPLVAKALGLTLSELDDEIQVYKLRSQTRRLLRGTDAELPMATPAAGSSGPPVRRRSAAEKAERAQAKRAPAAEEPAAAEPERSESRSSVRAALARPVRTALPPPSPAPAKAARAAAAPKAPVVQAEDLKAVLREVGPRRKRLCQRLGTGSTPLTVPALLARFRAAGLEREFGQRERDLARALLSRHRGAFAPVAAEMDLAVPDLQALLRERGLWREVEALRQKQQEKARAARWPQARIAQLLHQRDWLDDLGLLAELEEETWGRVRATWSELGGATGSKTEKLGKALHLSAADARALVERVHLE